MQNNINESYGNISNEQTSQSPQYVQPTQSLNFFEFQNAQPQNVEALNLETEAVVKIETKSEDKKFSNDDSAKVKENKVLKLLNKLLHVSVQSLLLLAFVMGVVAINGTKVNVLNFFYNIIDIFKINIGNWYYYLASCSQGITYLIVIIAMIINYVRAISHWRCGTPITLREYSLDLLKRSMIYFVVATTISTTELTRFSFVAFVISIVFISISVLIESCINRKITMENVIKGPVVFIVKCVALALIIKFTLNDCFAQIINGFVTFASINYEETEGFIYIIFENLGLPIITMIFMGFIISTINNMLFGNEKYQSEPWKKLMILSCVVFGLKLILYLAFSSGDVDTTQKIFDFIRVERFSSLPCILISIGVFVLTYNVNPIIPVQKKVLYNPAGQVKY